MCIYEVNIEIAPEIQVRYERWLKRHIEEILQIQGFLRAEVWYQQAPLTDGWIGLVIHYVLDSEANLAAYLEHHAPRLRQDAENHFSGRFRSHRRVLVNRQKLNAPNGA